MFSLGALSACSADLDELYARQCDSDGDCPTGVCKSSGFCSLEQSQIDDPDADLGEPEPDLDESGADLSDADMDESEPDMVELEPDLDESDADSNCPPSIVCEVPSTTCDGDVLTTYGSSTCVPETGQCSTPSSEVTDCADTGMVCRDGACVDLCEGVICGVPSPTCEGHVLTTYGSSTCVPATGECSTPSAETTDCADTGVLCRDGACVDLCGEMVSVPGGDFERGSTVQTDEQPVREIYVSSFCIDRTEVTAGAYEDCVQGGGCTAASNRFSECTYGVSGKSDHPINCVDWNQALAYCEWAGKRLPSEAEWEKAARGVDGRTYPWGEDEPDCNYAVMDDGGWGCGRDETWPVGSKVAGASPYGALDMAGNVHEWVNDRYDSGYYADAPLSDPMGPLSGSPRVVRGGSWSDVGVSLRAAIRGGFPPDYAFYNLGFRCARTP